MEISPLSEGQQINRAPNQFYYPIVLSYISILSYPTIQSYHTILRVYLTILSQEPSYLTILSYHLSDQDLTKEFSLPSEIHSTNWKITSRRGIKEIFQNHIENERKEKYYFYRTRLRLVMPPYPLYKQIVGQLLYFCQ